MDQKKVESSWQKFLLGEREAFAIVYQHYRPQLNFFCLGRLKDRELAERYSSEALIKVFNHEDPASIRDLTSWLFTIARNLCNSHVRTDQRRAQIIEGILPGMPANQEAEVDQKHAFDQIDHIIRTELNELEYQVWQLHMEGYDNEEIAEKLEMKLKTVANKKTDIRKRLRLAVGKKDNF